MYSHCNLSKLTKAANLSFLKLCAVAIFYYISITYFDEQKMENELFINYCLDPWLNMASK